MRDAQSAVIRAYKHTHTHTRQSRILRTRNVALYLPRNRPVTLKLPNGKLINHHATPSLPQMCGFFAESLFANIFRPPEIYH